MQYTVDEIYNLLFSKVNGIYDIFKGFFGKDRVDLQPFAPAVLKKSIQGYLLNMDIIASDDGKIELNDSTLDKVREYFSLRRADIYVWWPWVTVTNENDKSVDIQDLYAKVTVQLDGRIPYENHGFLLNRATYTQAQFIYGYVHSHVSNIPKNDFSVFQHPCLGTGPIGNTIGSLKNSNDEALWMLFCQELGMYVTVESLAGVPYNKLEGIGSDRNDPRIEYYDYGITGCCTKFLNLFSREELKEFIGYYLSNGHLSLGFINGQFKCCMSLYDFIVYISNCFIDFYNESLNYKRETPGELYAQGLLKSVFVADDKFYTKGVQTYTPSYWESYQDKYVLTFKGMQIKTRIILENNPDEGQLTTILDNGVAMYILNNILRTINYRYRNERNHRNQSPSTACERVIYL